MESRDLTPSVDGTPLNAWLCPPGATISELEKKAADCEEKARQHGEPEVAKLEGRGAAIPRVDRRFAIW
jgi:hypothetical protein